MQKFWICHNGEATPVIASTKSEAASFWLRRYEEEHSLAIAKECESFTVVVFTDAEYEATISEANPWQGVLHYGEKFQITGKMQPQYTIKRQK